MVYRGFTFLLIMCFAAKSTAQRPPVVEIPPGITLDNLYCWMYGIGAQNLVSTDCNRTCVEGARPRLCVFNFVLELYHQMGSACGNCSQGVLQDCMHPQCIPGDGTERGVMSINRRRIGPEINVCLNDVLAINVDNRMGGTESTLHWHGILQEGTQWMDGVPKVTQCGIPEGSSFRYVFPVIHPGTYFYHSHTGLHKTNGHNGALVVRQPRGREPARNLYTEDKPLHVIVLTDPMHDSADMFFPGLPTRQPGIGPVTFLINGLGRWRNPATNQTTRTPLATFHVRRGFSYRFRLINAASLICPMQFQIQNHRLTVIATDGDDVVPYTVDGIVSLSGERFDFIVNASQTGVAFWIHIRGLFVCEEIDRIDQVGVLSYGTADDTLGIYPTTPQPTMDNPLPFTTRLNHPQASCTQPDSEICVSELQGYAANGITQATNVPRVNINFGYWEWTVPTLHGTAANPDTEYNPFQLRPVMALESGVVNGITMEFPDRPSMLDSINNVRNSCNQQNRPSNCAAGGFCKCTHIITLPYTTTIDLILQDVNPTPPAGPQLAHPFHLHGYKFYVMEIARRNETLTMTRSQSPSQIPPLKDTVLIPQGGRVRIRINTGNPGDWLLHCHFEWHMMIGMSVILRVAGPLRPPPPNFPTCGTFEPASRDSCPMFGSIFGSVFQSWSPFNNQLT